MPRTNTPVLVEYFDSRGLPILGCFGSPVFDDEPGCECEIDWDCGRHGGSRPTWLETRWDSHIDMDEPSWA